LHDCEVIIEKVVFGGVIWGRWEAVLRGSEGRKEWGFRIVYFFLGLLSGGNGGGKFFKHGARSSFLMAS
jgi:hypothetical protein